MTPSGPAATCPAVVADLARRCAAGGLDLVQPLQAGWYNDSVDPDNRLDDYGEPDSLVVLIGNTRRIWPELIAALRQRGDLLQAADPLDAYVEETIGRAVNAVPLDSCIRWAHRPQPHHIAIQQMAGVAGLAWRSPASLSIHPVYGPWIGLRAAIVFPIPGPRRRPPPAPACRSCPTACQKVLNENAGDGWQHQLAVRDACPIGRQFRYSERQIAYHYTKSKEILRAAIDTSD